MTALVTPDWCRLLARYNAWQNEGLLSLVPTLPEEELRRDRGAFFGSILATLSHLLWADRVWLARLHGEPVTFGGIPESVALAPTLDLWVEERRRADQRLLTWAEGISMQALSRDFAWTGTGGGPPRSQPLGLVVSHMFNHQTHHRGQVHAMLTAAGVTPQPTDLIAMPA